MVKFGAIESRPYLQNKQSVRILQAAREIFIREGGAAFSARRVAKAAKLSLGSVQHVFPTTDALLKAMLENVNDEYEVAYEAMTARLPFNAEKRLHAYIDYLLEDVCRHDTRKFWFGFWALSCHNEQAEVLLAEAYRHHSSNVARFIGAARPAILESDCRQLAMHVVALIDGMMIFTGGGDRELTLRSPLIQGVRKTLFEMLSTSRAA